MLAPGSRNAPLAFAAYDAAEAGLVRLHTRIDERTAGFLALGLTKTGAPAAVICTSGTAVANLHPAMLEAAHAGVPLVAVTADRPARLRGTGANQTTDQVGIFGPLVRHASTSTDGRPSPAGLLVAPARSTSTCSSTSRWCRRTAGRPTSTPRRAAERGRGRRVHETIAARDRGRSWSPATTPGRRRGCWPSRRTGRCSPSPPAARAPATHAIRTYRLLLDGDARPTGSSGSSSSATPRCPGR